MSPCCNGLCRWLPAAQLNLAIIGVLHAAMALEDPFDNLGLDGIYIDEAVFDIEQALPQPSIQLAIYVPHEVRCLLPWNGHERQLIAFRSKHTSYVIGRTHACSNSNSCCENVACENMQVCYTYSICSGHEDG